MIIYAKTLTGQVYKLEVELTNTVDSVRDQIAEQIGLDKNCIRLICKGKDLLHEDYLSKYAIDETSIIHVVFRMKH